MKVLDLFCGRGGWSKPFVEDGDEVWGIDIKDYDYPGKLIRSDIRELDGYSFHDVDFVIGSPPCSEFSIAKNLTRQKRDVAKGLELIKQFFRFTGEASPKFWAMENVSQLERWWHSTPIWRFRISVNGRRSLWGNLSIHLSPEFRFKRGFAMRRETRPKYRASGNYVDKCELRAEIPYPIARFIADTVKAALA